MYFVLFGINIILSILNKLSLVLDPPNSIASSESVALKILALFFIKRPSTIP